MKRFKEWLRNKSYQKWEWWIETLSMAYVIWAVVMYIASWIDFGDKIPGGNVDIGFMLIATFFFFVPFVLGFLLGKTYNR